MKKALIAMSGGVDSSVAALLTKESGAAFYGLRGRKRRVFRRRKDIGRGGE